MTPKELAAKVADNNSRPDLEDQILTQLPIALRSAHGVNEWRRDLKILNVIDPSVISSVSTISIATTLPKLRKVFKLRAYSAYTGTAPNQIPNTEIPSNFTNITDGEFNYYGLAKTQTYGIFGDLLNINGVDSTTKAFGVQGLFWPSYTFNALTGEYETDSWLMKEFTEIVECYLNLWVAQRLKDKDGIQITSSELGRVRSELITTYPEELL